MDSCKDNHLCNKFPSEAINKPTSYLVNDVQLGQPTRHLICGNIGYDDGGLGLWTGHKYGRVVWIFVRPIVEISVNSCGFG